jgi:alkylation response protein AidB-like acyl-CoA dehydrogenase
VARVDDTLGRPGRPGISALEISSLIHEGTNQIQRMVIARQLLKG